MRLLAAFVFALALPVEARDPGVQRALIQRDQQSAAFALQLRQSQEALKVAPANRANLESRQLWHRQQLETLSAKQLIEVKPETPEALRSYERQKLEVERAPFRSPIVEVLIEAPR